MDALTEGGGVVGAGVGEEDEIREGLDGPGLVAVDDGEALVGGEARELAEVAVEGLPRPVTVAALGVGGEREDRADGATPLKSILGS